MGDEELQALVGAGSLVRNGIGGTALTVHLDGVPLFMKKVPLTDVERRPENVFSTANHFGLPMYYQYGLGSAGFGVWRELAVHQQTTDWVVRGECASFPLMHHWRVLPGSPPPLDPAAIEGLVEHWGGSVAIRDRIESISRATASVVLFLEYIPHTVNDWLSARLASDGASAIALVERCLADAVSFMNARGLLHFDAHFRNVLTDGSRLYFADFGLAMHSGFAMSAEEKAFYALHSGYDRCYTAANLVNWLRSAGDLPDTAAAIVDRHATVAAVWNTFWRTLKTGDKTTRYPAEELLRALEPRPAGRRPA